MIASLNFPALHASHSAIWFARPGEPAVRISKGDAIGRAAKALERRKAERAVILALTLTGGQPDSVEPRDVLNDIRSSGAMLNVVHVIGARPNGNRLAEKQSIREENVNRTARRENSRNLTTDFQRLG